MFWPLYFCLVFIQAWHSQNGIYYLGLYYWLNYLESCDCFIIFSQSATHPTLLTCPSLLCLSLHETYPVCCGPGHNKVYGCGGSVEGMVGGVTPPPP